MPRKSPPERFDEIVRAATEVFSVQGYRLTQMAVIAEAAGVSKATLYLYVESKDALLSLCLEHADDPKQLEKPDVVPVPTPGPGQLVQRLTERLTELARFPVLEAALGRSRAADIESELGEILHEMYTLLESNCRSVRLVERCSDHPELGPVWHEMVRGRGRGDLARYVESRMRAGQLRSVEHPTLAARVALETVATWAMHIKWDKAPEAYDPVSTKPAVIAQIVRGLL